MVKLIIKNKLYLTALLALAFFGSLFITPHNMEKLNIWADSLFRKPGDPPYLSLHYRIRTLYFDFDPVTPRPIVFLGDSITYGGDWQDLFPGLPVENRGIGGDSTLGLLNRLDQVITLKPSQVFLMIGTNDLCYGRDIPGIIANYRIILNRFKTEIPDAKVYVQNVLPFNDQIFPSRGFRTIKHIQKLNKELQLLAKEYNYPYVDLASVFAGQGGRLPAKFTSDGLHLSDPAYLVWRDQIRNLVATSKVKP